jgi:hypothetical protein
VDSSDRGIVRMLQQLHKLGMLGTQSIDGHLPACGKLSSGDPKLGCGGIVHVATSTQHLQLPGPNRDSPASLHRRRHDRMLSCYMLIHAADAAYKGRAALTEV